MTKHLEEKIKSAINVATKLNEFDDSFRDDKNDLIFGADEAGRGPLCGPVFCAGVIMRPDFHNGLINDSKKLTEAERDYLFNLIIENAIDYKIIKISADEIDEINILESSRKGMQIAFNELSSKHQIKAAITDYMKINTGDVELISIPKGDATSFSVACASILAKVSRDRYMIELDKKYPQYDFKNNKGYGTKKHLEAIENYGIIEGEHRKTFTPVKKFNIFEI